jgi:hypothetical protein
MISVFDLFTMNKGNNPEAVSIYDNKEYFNNLICLFF